MIDFNPAEKQTLDFASRALRDNPVRSQETILKVVEAGAIMAKMTFPDDPINVEAIVSELRHSASVWTERPAMLSDGRVKPWLRSHKASVNWQFWERYKTYLHDKKGIRDKPLEGIDELTDLILDKLKNPSIEGEWDIRGMVVGSVQSGKTANYVGLIAKALDVGYKLIIVLAGIHNNLRAQTQERIDEGIIGFDSQRRLDPNRTDYRVGVGQLLGNQLRITPLTSSAENGDFSTAAQRVNVALGGDPVILVIKKNCTPLRHILRWTEVVAGRNGPGHPQTIDQVPLLLIDDEADNASINTKDKPGSDESDITAINKSIRLILRRFKQSAYVGYTATPFANIFINPDSERDDEGKDLFPRNFILNVRPNGNYIGPAKMFGYDDDLEAGIEGAKPLPMFREVDDHLGAFPTKHKGNHVIPELPDSLKIAILSFLLVCAARRARGQRNVHNSMLIHATRLNLVQEQLFKMVQDEFRRLKRSVAYAQNDSSDPVWTALRKQWEQDFIPTTDAIRGLTKDERLTSLTWEQVAAEMHAAVERIEPRQINGLSKEALDYSRSDSGLSLIAIGGNKLSRGLTLEGLTVSYFLRPTRMYDTLMQMGRWFGYREGYVDLCRLYTTVDLRDWFRHVALAEEELKGEFDRMEAADLTPMDYGLRVREHPDGLLVTALNKMAHGSTRSLTYAGQLVQTAYFHKDQAIQASNLAVVKEFTSSLGPCISGDTRIQERAFIWQNVPAERVTQFLDGENSGLSIHPKCTRFGPELVKFIEMQKSIGEIRQWTVVLISNSEAEKHAQFADGIKVGLTQRAEEDAHPAVYALTKANILSPEDEAYDLRLESLRLDSAILEQLLNKYEVRADGAADCPVFKEGIERETLRKMQNERASLFEVALAISQLRHAVGEYRSKKPPKRPYGEVIRQVRPATHGLMLIYLLDPSKVFENSEEQCIPGFALSFPSSHRANQVDYRVTPGWLKLHGWQETDEDE